MPFLPDLSILTSIYRGEKYLAGFFENLRSQTMFPRCEIVLVLNEASQEEIKTAEEFASEYRSQVQLQQLNKVGTLGASWNRAWQVAQAPYLALWNVDDRRTPDSLDRQLAALEEHRDWVLCYGDYVTVFDYGEEKGKLRSAPAYNPGYFRRAFAQGGAFWVFRDSIGEQVGYFDEQFQVAADMDYSFRMASGGLRMGRCEGLLGYFTDAGQGLSTREGAHRSAIERTAIQLRYGVYDKVNPKFAKEALGYRLDAVKSLGEWHPLSEYLPRHEKDLQRRSPLRLLGKLRNAMRTLLEQLGLLRWLYKLQDRYWKREI